MIDCERGLGGSNFVQAFVCLFLQILPRKREREERNGMRGAHDRHCFQVSQPAAFGCD